MSNAARSAVPYQQVMTDSADGSLARDATRIVLRPIASPLPMGFLALFVGSLLVSALQLHWVPAAQRHEVAIGVLAFTVPLQVIACLYGFLCRDVVASTGLGLLAATWAVLGVTSLTTPPQATSPGLGILLVVAGLALYAALAAEVDSATRRSLLPLLRPAPGQRAVSGRLTDQTQTLPREAGVRQQL